MHLQLQDMDEPKTNPSEPEQSAAQTGFTKLYNLWTLHTQIQDIADPKTSPSLLQSVAQAGF